MIYHGIHSGGQLPRSYAHKEESHRKMFRGKEVIYYHVWKQNPDEIKPHFKTEKLDKVKVRATDKALKIIKTWQ